MNVRYIAVLILSLSAVGVAMGAALQGPGNEKTVSAAESTHRASQSKPTNLKVLPKDMSGDDVDKLMHRYDQYLGVPCGYCHEENPQSKQIDYVSDENPVKETARFMISMTSDLNNKYLAQLGDRRYAEPFTCGNCHLGHVQPPAFGLKPEQ